jgi:glycosyltransferase involved in cell wall biosynthesis
MSRPPRFSVVIPVHNRAASVGATLASVREQSFKDFECIVVDDGSDDGAALEAAVRTLDDPRFRYLRRANGGGGAARNSGTLAARGDYIAFLDSDDLFLPRKLELFQQHLRDDPGVVHYSRMFVERGVSRRWIRPDRAIAPGETVAEYLFVANQFIQTSTLVLPRATAKQVMFDESLRKGQDLDLCVRLALAGKRFEMLDAPLVVWTDVTEAGRTSRQAGHAAPARWLQRMAPDLPPRAVLGYRATVLAYYIGWRDPLRALRDLWAGYRHAGVPGRVVARQALRSFLPRRLYRALVAGVVQVAGRR